VERDELACPDSVNLPFEVAGNTPAGWAAGAILGALAFIAAWKTLGSSVTAVIDSIVCGGVVGFVAWWGCREIAEWEPHLFVILWQNLLIGRSWRFWQHKFWRAVDTFDAFS
jgi:hypothetical protein